MTRGFGVLGDWRKRGMEGTRLDVLILTPSWTGHVGPSSGGPTDRAWNLGFSSTFCQRLVGCTVALVG